MNLFKFGIIVKDKGMYKKLYDYTHGRASRSNVEIKGLKTRCRKHDDSYRFKKGRSKLNYQKGLIFKQKCRILKV